MRVILKVAVPFPLRQCFDYLPPENTPAGQIQIGARVLVPFGRRRTVGYLVGWDSSGSSVDPSRLKTALSILDAPPLLSPDDCENLRWASRYYHHPLGEVFASALPVLLRQGRPASGDLPRHLCLTAAGRTAPVGEKRAPRQSFLLAWLRERESGIPWSELETLEWDWRAVVRSLVARGWAQIVEVERTTVTSSAMTASPPALNADQRQAVREISAALGRYAAFLLEGVTGSGKTEVYLQLVAEVLARGEQVMVLLPEIGLTPQLLARFRRRFAVPIAVFHSGINETERCRAWLSVQSGETPVLIGARSAVFTPLARPGLIILDEEHDASFKQQDGFRFSARDVAVMRARRANIPVVMGSATPSLESLQNVRRGRYRHLRLPNRAGASAPPRFRLIDLRGRRLQEGLSAPLVAEIEATLARGEQSLLFLNRRGFAPTLICHACGWVADCRRCDTHLVLHAEDRRLCCHHCGHERAVPRQCPECGVTDLRPLGLGTERVERILQKLFPQARTVRIDRDSTRRKGSLETMLDDVCAGRVGILLGTQMLAKGHHFPDVTLVGILDVDAGLYSADFRASERTAQLIVQVAGRAGRAERPGTVILQTRHPEHPLLVRLIHQGYPGFSEAALAERQGAMLPPFSHQALWRAEAKSESGPKALLERVREMAGRERLVQVLGPAPAPMPRRAGRYRSQLLFQCIERKPLHALINSIMEQLGEVPEAKLARWSVDIDPADLY
ncbi:MAG: primosomal protein [Proteobacteria bacterium]|nr:primosomal protein [Pseudomonadota bacterium]